MEESCVVQLALASHDRIRACCLETARDVRSKEDVAVGKHWYGDGLRDCLDLAPVRETLRHVSERKSVRAGN